MFHVAGYDRDGVRLFGPVELEAPTEAVAKLLVSATLRRHFDGIALIEKCEHMLAASSAADLARLAKRLAK